MEPRGGRGERRPEKETTPEEGITHPVTRMGKLRSVEPSQRHGVGAGTARDLGEFRSVGFTELAWHPTVVKRQTVASVGKDVEKSEPSCAAGGNGK